MTLRSLRFQDSLRPWRLQGQSMVEYALLIAIVTGALLGMQTYAKRGIQAGIKRAADHLSPFPNDATGERAQLAGVQYESGERQNRTTAVPGAVRERESATTTASTRTITEQELAGGGRTRVITTDTAETVGALDPRRGAGASSYSEVVTDDR